MLSVRPPNKRLYQTAVTPSLVAHSSLKAWETLADPHKHELCGVLDQLTLCFAISSRTSGMRSTGTSIAV